MGYVLLATGDTVDYKGIKVLKSCFSEFSLNLLVAPPFREGHPLSHSLGAGDLPYLYPVDKRIPSPQLSEGRGYAYKSEGEDQRERLVRLALVVVLLHIINEGTID